jgi:GntR family transcriptional regulator, transcriptional repressor for pyruvate dehydrogenase complex
MQSVVRDRGRVRSARKSPPPARADRRRLSRALGVPLGKDSVVSLVLGRIKEALLRKDLKPGEYLPSETELTNTLGVSKSSVREAVKMLQAMGVVEVRRGQGTLVRQHPGPDYISPLVFQLIMEAGYPDDLVELRLMFEPAFAVMAMERATDDDRDRIRHAMERLERSVQSGSPVAEEDIAFHLAMLQATKNPLVTRIGETIFQLFQASISVSMTHIADRAVQDHRRIFEAFCSRDPDRLRAAVLQSYDGWKESLYREKGERA